MIYSGFWLMIWARYKWFSDISGLSFLSGNLLSHSWDAIFSSFDFSGKFYIIFNRAVIILSWAFAYSLGFSDP